MRNEYSNILTKYNVPGPRYTSYPTVPYWETNPTIEEWSKSVEQSISLSQNTNKGIAIYIHIPFCETLCSYCGCNTRITRRHDLSLGYIDTLLKEWQLYLNLLQSEDKIKVSEIHLGGGTPTFMSPKELNILMNGILSRTSLMPDYEFSIEVDPRVTTKEHIDVLADLGFKRISIGIQDFDLKVQKAVNRVQAESQISDLSEYAKLKGFESINYDLIYGLPFQTEASITESIKKIIQLRPDRIAFYSYAHVPWIKPSQRKFTEADLPSGTEKRKLYEVGRFMLEDAGYVEIGMDHFALKSDSLWAASQNQALHRNFMGYTSRHSELLIGLGVSAISDSWNMFAQNEKVLEVYQSKIEAGELAVFRGHILSEEDLILRRHILNLMTNFETDWTKDSNKISFFNLVPEKLSEFEMDGLLKIDGKKCNVSEKGRPFLRNICMAFDARLARKSPDMNLFSKTI